MRVKDKMMVIALLAASSFSFGQIEKYDYKRELGTISAQWHKIILPDDMFGKVRPDLSDIRIYGITANNDTVEAPYLIRLTTEKTSDKKVIFKTLNVSHNEKGYYFTFDIPAEEPINRIDLEFNRQNFDWRVNLEGSNDQREWFIILEDYRILSIRNESTDFQFTTINFPDSKYRFFRVLVKANEKPRLENAVISLHEESEGLYNDYPVNEISVKEDKPGKQTVVDLKLQMPVPVSLIKINIADTFDYYRPVRVRYLVDSVETEQGWKYNYSTLAAGTLTSIESNEFLIDNRILQRLRITIDNQDNPPLIIEGVVVKGYVHELAVRLTEPATYFLVYGNERAKAPNYDIKRFVDKIPENLTPLEMGPEISTKKEVVHGQRSLFADKGWLWAIMTVIILILGWFSIKMIRNG